MNIRTVLRCSLGLALGVGAFAQRTPPPATPNPNVPSTNNNTNSLPNSNTNTAPTMTPDLRPLYLSGKVTLDDGTPPGEQVAIQLSCRGNPRTIGNTDMRGTFSIDLTNRNNPAVLEDASQSGRPSPFGSGGGMSGMQTSGGVPNSGASMANNMERSLMGCDIRAALAGFRSDEVQIGQHRSLDNPDIGTIVLHRIASVEGLTISVTTARAPKEAQKAFEKGMNLARKAKWDDAHKEFEKAVTVYPAFALAWYNLGRVQEEQKDLEGARKSYATALTADPKFVSPYQTLALMAAREQKWQEVADNTSHLLKLNPIDFPQSWLYNSMANYYMQKMDLAEESARSGLSHDPNHRFAKLSQVLAAVLAQKRDYAGAVANMRDYLKYAPNATDTEIVKKQLAELEKEVESGAVKADNSKQ